MKRPAEMTRVWGQRVRLVRGVTVRPQNVRSSSPHSLRPPAHGECHQIALFLNQHGENRQ